MVGAGWIGGAGSIGVGSIGGAESISSRGSDGVECCGCLAGNSGFAGEPRDLMLNDCYIIEKCTHAHTCNNQFFYY